MTVTPSARFEALLSSVRHLYETERYAEAVSPAEEATAVSVQHFGINSREYGRAAHALGKLHRETGNYESSETLLGVALTIRSRDGEMHPDVADILLSLANLQMDCHRYDTAEALYQRALDIAQGVGDVLLEGGCLNGLANIRRLTERYVEAARHFDDMLKLLRIHPSQAQYLATTLINYSRLRRDMGDLVEAGSLAREGLRIAEAEGHRRRLVARCLTNLASIRIDLGHLDVAKSHLHMALRIYGDFDQSCFNRFRHSW
jgi:tetratricopeptide (TPR) repeat protein